MVYVLVWVFSIFKKFLRKFYWNYLVYIFNREGKMILIWNRYEYLWYIKIIKFVVIYVNFCKLKNFVRKYLVFSEVVL